MINRTARVFSTLGRSLIQTLDPLVQDGVSDVSAATNAIQQTMLEALAQGYWLEYVFSKERLAAVHGTTYRGRVSLSDQDEEERQREALQSLIRGNGQEWRKLIPETAVDWVKGYASKLALKDITKWRTEAIARTEITRADTMGRLIRMKDDEAVLGVEFCAILDGRTTPICVQRHGLLMRLDDPRLLFNTPPLHVNCRSFLLSATLEEHPEGVHTDARFDAIEPAQQRPEDIDAIREVLEEFLSSSETPETPETPEMPETSETSEPFVPAKTLKGAEKFAVEKNIAWSANFKGLSVDTANQINESVLRAQNIFPEMRGRLEFVGSAQEHNKLIHEIRIENYIRRLRKMYPDESEEWLREVSEVALKPSFFDKENVIAMSCNMDDVRGISVNTEFGSARKAQKALETLQKDVDDKFHPVGCATIKAIVDHEVGHQITDLVDGAEDPVLNFLYNDLIARDVLTDSLSEYAEENILEFIAEAWSEYMNNPVPRAVAKKVGERLIKLKELTE